VYLLLLAAAIIAIAGLWEASEGWLWLSTALMTYGFFTALALLCALLAATPLWSLQILSGLVVTVFGVLWLGYYVASQAVLILKGEWILRLGTPEDRFFVAGLPVLAISVLVPVLLVVHLVTSGRTRIRNA
jgi:hypothetical protein